MFRTLKDWILLEKKEADYSYSCVMFMFPSKDAKSVMDWSKEHIPEDVVFEDDDKGREDEIHITVLYGLHTNEVEPVEEVISKWSPFEIELGEISKFESGDYDVLKIGISGDDLHDANKSLRELDYTSNYNEYRPHCTIAYVKKGSCDDLLGNKDFYGKKITVNEVVFSPAEGDRTKIKIT